MAVNCKTYKQICTRALFIGLLICFCNFYAHADHITGGEMYYTSVQGPNGNLLYFVTLKLFMRCNSGRQFNNPAIVSVFKRGSNQRVADLDVILSNQSNIELSDAGPCVTNPPKVCYVIGTYTFNVSLPPSVDGYILSSQVNFRISGITNMTSGYTNIGATYTCEIPGTGQAAAGPFNNSAKFTGSDLVVVCAKNRFTYSFGASDPDGDQLRYSFCNAFVSGSASFGNNNAPPPDPPYSSVPYESGFSGAAPLGPQVQIDSRTGLITGIAPPTGIYVVTVCVEEIRNGIVIAVQRKDLQINIAACDIAGAVLQPEYQLCSNTTTISLTNQSISNLIKTQNWEIRDNHNTRIFDTSGTTLNYNFKDTGIYSVKLVINKGGQCSDSTLSLIRVYPGFKPGFSFAGICFSKPTVFKNVTTTVYGALKSLSWDFGDGNLLTDTSTLRDPVYTYTVTGAKIPILTAVNTNGCRDTASRYIPIFTKPPLNLSFTDTLICINDSVRLNADGSGKYQWTPALHILNAGTNTPTVAPGVTTRYYVDIDDQGCLNRDSVLVRVTDHVDLSIMNDTTICQGDDIVLNITSNGFRYAWSPADQLDNASAATPVASTFATTTYRVTALIGSCHATRQVVVTTVPYPLVNAGADTVLCFNTTGQLHGVTNGASFKWSPALYLDNSNVLNPTVKPTATTTYILSASDTKGCPKPGRDTVTIKVLPDLRAYAGADTAIVLGQELQLRASGGTKYLWSPPWGLSAANVADPVARFSEQSEGMHYLVTVSNEAGCIDTASINIKVYNTIPTVFIPTAFTPNNDGHNDVLRPVSAGIKRMDNFSVFNRWGNLVFSTGESGKGWDGKLSGLPQATGTYIWMVKAIDYLGKPYLKKGTVVLIR